MTASITELKSQYDDSLKAFNLANSLDKFDGSIDQERDEAATRADQCIRDMLLTKPRNANERSIVSSVWVENKEALLASDAHTFLNEVALKLRLPEVA